MQNDIERKIAVIFETDAVSFSKLMEKNEEETLRSFRSCREILNNLFKEHGGRIFNTAGDSVLAEFPSAVSAVICAKEFQNLVHERNQNVLPEAQMSFRIGINMGDVIVEGEKWRISKESLAYHKLETTVPSSLIFYKKEEKLVID